MSDEREPTCYLDDDGEHFHFVHRCASVADRWSAAGHPLDPDSAARFQEASDHRVLPATDAMLPNSKGWRIVSRDPLTIEPSILCGHCGVHGFFREGRWVPA